MCFGNDFLYIFLDCFHLILYCLKKAQGYNYDRPESARPTAQGFGGPAAQTTPSYVAPAFPLNPATAQGGYNYPAQSDTDFPTAIAPTGSGYPTGPQAPAGRPQGFSPTSVGSPYPAAGNQGAFGGIGQAATGFGQQPGVSAIGGINPIGGINSIGGVRPPQGLTPTTSLSGQQQDENQEGDYSAIPGEPDVDYPILSEIPETSFDCSQQEFPGYYADVEARCQVFHVCAFNNTRKYDFLCPNGTIFSQEFLVCVWWNQFDCNSAPGLFANNANLYETPQANQQGAPQGVQGGIPSGLANDYPSSTGPGVSGNYPAPGRPTINAGSSFGGSNIPSTAYGVPSTAPASAAGNYQPSGPTGSNYPAATAVGSAGNYPSPPSQSQYPSTQGPYPSAPNVPSTGYQPPQAYPSQSDTPYPPSAATPPRDYLPPRRG